MPFYSPEFVIQADIVVSEFGQVKPTGITNPVFVKVCEACGSMVILEDVHDQWHYQMALKTYGPSPGGSQD